MKELPIPYGRTYCEPGCTGYGPTHEPVSSGCVRVPWQELRSRHIGTGRRSRAIARHQVLSVPFHRLADLHRAVVAKAGREPPTMGYFEFQRETLRRLSGGRERIDYADDAVWIEPSR